MNMLFPAMRYTINLEVICQQKVPIRLKYNLAIVIL